MKASWDDYSQYMESQKSHVPNHQPVMFDYRRVSVSSLLKLNAPVASQLLGAVSNISILFLCHLVKPQSNIHWGWGCLNNPFLGTVGIFYCWVFRCVPPFLISSTPNWHSNSGPGSAAALEKASAARVSADSICSCNCEICSKCRSACGRTSKFGMCLTRGYTMVYHPKAGSTRENDDQPVD